MMNIVINRVIGLAFVSTLLPGWAMDFDKNFDISSGATSINSPIFANVDAELQAAEWLQQLNLSPKFNLWLYPNDALEVSLRYGLNLVSTVAHSEQGLRQASSQDSANYFIADFESSIWQSESGDSELTQQLEQLVVTYWGDNSSLSVGRQALSFGLAKVFSPADVIQPTSIDFSQSGYRQGVDAIRSTWFVGAVSEVDVGVVIGEDKVAFGRLKTNLNSVDYDVTAIQINNDIQVFSIGLQGGVSRFGLWQETALLNDFDEFKLRASVGIDTTVLDDLYLMAEYHFNGVGATANVYDSAATSEYYQLGAVQPYGQQYLSIAASLPINPLVQWNLNWVGNLNDQSGIGLTSITASMSDSVSALASITLPYGVYDVSEISEYGAYPFVFNASVNWVF